MTTTAPDPDAATIRRVERGDLLDVLRIEKASFLQPWPYEAFTRFLGEPGFLVAVVEGGSLGPLSDADHPSVVGYVVADTVPNHGRAIGHVKDLAVHPDHRRRGIGRRLLDRALSAIAAQGVTRTKLEVRRGNDSALELYDEFGFEPNRVVPRYYDDGEDALVLVTDLADR